MKTYNLTPQENNMFCVPSCLQAIFRNYGLEILQNEIASELTRERFGYSMTDGKIGQFLEGLGFNYEFYVSNKTPFNEPDFLLESNGNRDVIVGVSNHCCLLLGYNYPNLNLLNPRDASSFEFDLAEVLKETVSTESGLFAFLSKI